MKQNIQEILATLRSNHLLYYQCGQVPAQAAVHLTDAERSLQYALDSLPDPHTNSIPKEITDAL